MPGEFMVFRQPRSAMNPRKLLTVVDFRKSPGSYGIQNMEVLKDDGKLELSGEFGDFRIFTFSGTCYTAKPGVAKTAPEAFLTFEAWQRKGGELVTVLASRVMARAVVPLLSFAAFAKTDVIKEIGVGRDEYLGMVEGALKKKGRVSWVTFRGIQTKNVKIKRLEAIGPDINRLAGFDEMMRDESVKIQKMGFSISGILWTIADWGGGQILTPSNPRREDLLEFCDMLEDFLFKQPEKSKRTTSAAPLEKHKTILG